MRRRVIAVVVYGVAFVLIGGFFDALYGGEPMKRGILQAHIATVGLFVFPLAALVSLGMPRAGLVCGVVAEVLSWQFLGPIAIRVPWGSLGFMQAQPDIPLAILGLSIATVFSIWHLGKISGKGSGLRSRV